MKEYTNYLVSDFIQEVLSSDICHELFSGELYDLLNINVDRIIERFNKGDYDVLNEEDCQRLINIKINARKVLVAIINMKKIVECKNYMLKIVEKKKDKMSYNPQERIYVKSFGKSYTFEYYFQLLEKVEKILNDKRTYQLLNFLLKNENLIPQLKGRIHLLETLKNNPEKSKELLEVLKKEDDDIGIVRTDDDGEISVGVGTRKDMEISNLICRPFKRDCDIEGYSYGPHDDYWKDPHKVTKTFHENGETKLHKRMIDLEREKRRTLPYYSTDEIGFIYGGDYALIISRREVIAYGIDPEAIGWVPLRLERKPKTLFSLIDESTPLNLREVISTKKDELALKLRK